MQTRSRLRAIAPHLRIVAVAVLALLTTPALVGAQDDALPECAAGLRADTTLPDPTWRTVVDVGHAFALRLPPGHVIAGGDGSWYVHGFLDGAPLAPDVAISLLTGIDIDEAVGRDYPAEAVVERLRLGPATTGARVEALYTAPDGTTYRQAGYLVETVHGVLRIDRYEGVDWDGFDAVACSAQVVEFLD
jgi:hypothetical protein